MRDHLAIRIEMMRKGVTQSEVARNLGYTRTMVGHIIYSRRKDKTDILKELIKRGVSRKALGLSQSFE